MTKRTIRRAGLLSGVLLFSLLSLCACGEGTSGDEAPDGDLSERTDWPEADREGAERDDGDVPQEARENEGTENEAPLADGDEQALENETSDAADGESGEQPGEAEPEAEVTDRDSEAPAPGACASLSDCTGFDVCNMAYGRCERREVWPVSSLALSAVNPPSVAANDYLVIDGARYYAKLLGGSSQVKVKIGATDVTLSNVGIDENRIVLRVKNGLSGVVTVSGEKYANGQIPSASFATPLGAASAGGLACDGTTPQATNVAGQSPSAHGPYAAGFIDFPEQSLRLSYPASCGGLRRPPVAGTYPFVVILHGDGGIFLNYEYLAQHLASWGFISIMPAEDTMPAQGQGYLDSSRPLQSIVNTYRGKDLGTVSSVLAGLVTRSEMALVGHSRGTARLEFLTQQDDMKAATLASVFLGPVDEGLKVERGAFMTFSASNDKQSSNSNSTGAYQRQAAPKWHFRINGGNHSLFTDYKTWSGVLGDAQPTLTRREQFLIVAQFVLPLFQRVFKQAEPFAAYLDSPPASTLYTTTHE